MKKILRKAKTSLPDFCKALKKHDNFLLTCHVLPEGDAIGSILAIDSLLRRLGKKTTVVAEDAFPERLPCLKTKRWNTVRQVPKKKFDAMVTTDCATLARIGKVRELMNPGTVVLNIDHHISNSYFGHYNYVLPEAAASGEVVYNIFKHLKLKIRREEASYLYVALSTDTGSFKYGNTTVRSHQIAAELLKTGIPLEKINDDIYATYSLNKINLYSRLLSRVKTAARGKIAWVVMRREDLQHSGATYEDTEGFIDFLKYLREVKVAFFISETSQHHEARVSFRAKDSYDVNKIATYFKGGGHKKAAGCIIEAPVEQAEKKILDRLHQELKL